MYMLKGGIPMVDATYCALGSKVNFNKALRHFFKVTEAVDEVEEKNNLADMINVALEEGEMVSTQILPLVSAVLKDKFQYQYGSFELQKNTDDFTKISSETLKWTALDIVLLYFDPNSHVSIINPKDPSAWGKIREIMSEHLVVVYAKYLKDESDGKIEKEAIKAIEEMLGGKDIFINKKFVDENVRPVAAAKPKVAEASEASAGSKRSTPKYSVQVTNELFHNGNVEAWKKIIESYKTKYPGLDVKVFYEGEAINDLNTLFKWGKVKHHGLIFIQVVGEDIKGVSKLQKYLFEGASQRFEQFLHGPVGSVLNLF
ncbi:MAG TPA: hypothetical protein PLM72_05530 [Spirochaetota bacterium]|nr:hypothetical protein [Spirochaetota bacterium]